jgi:g-D-glutamyl-meso-diaminopimelate peptidase
MTLVQDYGSEALSNYIHAHYTDNENLRVERIGSSVENRPIARIRYGHGPIKLHVNAALHGNEWITSWVLIDAIEMLLTRPFARWTDRITIDFVPMVNPDGVERVLHGDSNWKANARGIDLNDQFPAGWFVEKRRRNIHTPAASDFAGHMPLSEPEAKTLSQLVRNNDYQSVMALHAQGEEIYYNYRGYEPYLASEWAHEMANVADYEAVALTDSDAGFKDWFIQEFRRPGFTVEVGRGKNPLQICELARICAKFRLLFEHYLLLNWNSVKN